MAKRFVYNSPNTLDDAYEMIKVLDWKLLQEFKLKNQMKQCDELLKENIEIYTNIFGILDPSKALQIKIEEVEPHIEIIDISKIKKETVDRTDTPSETSLTSIGSLDDAYVTIRGLKNKLFDIDYLKDIIQFLKANINSFEKMETMAKYSTEYAPYTLADGFEIIEMLDMKLLKVFNLKSQMKKCYMILKESIKIFQTIFENDQKTVKGFSKELQEQIEQTVEVIDITSPFNNKYVDNSETRLASPLESPFKSIYCLDDALRKIRDLQYKIFQIDYLKEIIQSLKENISVFEELISNFLLETNILNDMELVQVKTECPDEYDDTIFDNDNFDNSSDTDNDSYEAERKKVDVKIKKPGTKKKVTTNREIKTSPENKFSCNVCNEKFPSRYRRKLHNINTHMTAEEREQEEQKKSILKLKYSLNYKKTGKILKKNTVEEKYPCDLCNEKFTSHYRRRMHRWKIHNTREPVRTETQERISENMIIRQFAADKDNNKYSCDICDKVFYKYGKIRTHIVYVHRKIIACKTCGAKFSSIPFLKRHEVSHINKEARGVSYFCNICSAKFYTKSGYAGHIITHNPDKHHKCPKCSQTFTRKAYLTYHTMRRHGMEKPFTCNKCGRAFLIMSLLQRHMKLSHGNNKKVVKKFEPPRPQEPFKCIKCNRSYMILSALKRHMEQLHNENITEWLTETRKCICEICGMRFSTSLTLKQHKYTHSTELHTCQYCSHQFSRKQYLNVHIRKNHSQDKVYKCEVCKKKYIDVHRFETHKCINPATDASNKFTCDICNKQFSLATNFYNHTLMHRNIKPYKCHICSRCFSQRNSLNFHLKVHAGLKPYAKMKKSVKVE